MKINLGLHLGFAATRYNDPKIWTNIVRNELNLEYVQFVSDLLNPSMPNKTIKDEIKKINFYVEKNNIKIKHTLTSPRYNYLGHYNKEINNYWKHWLKKFINISAKLGAEGTGSLLGIFSFNDLENNFFLTRKKIIEGWVDLSKHAKKKSIYTIAC